jgi:uncharacterized protein YyaL (SSP411 family)
MSACQLLTGRGGWPLNVVLTPEKLPFFAGTYFPPTSRLGMIGMGDLAGKIQELWKTKRDKILRSADEITTSMRNECAKETPVSLDPDAHDRAFAELQKRFDSVHGGFGPAPKFPSGHTLIFLNNYWQKTGRPESREMLEKSLTAMRKGGIYDHLDSGFHRYSTDAEWLVPHFEKMLYDQALLALAYAEAGVVLQNDLFLTTANDVLCYVGKRLQHPAGSFYSAEDADSEGEEGRYYVWSISECRKILGDDAPRFAEIFGVREEGNFLDEATGIRTGANILHLNQDPHETPASGPVGEQNLKADIAEWQQKMLQAREKRIRPHRDDKVLTDWNGMMIAAFARCAALLGTGDLLNKSIEAAAFLREKMRDSSGRLLHRYCDGEAVIHGFLDDYAFMAWGLLEIFQANGNPAYLGEAKTMAQAAIDLFADTEGGGYFFTASDGEHLPVRRKDFHDSAIPSGNSVFLSVLKKLHQLTGGPHYEEAARRLVRAAAPEVNRFPSAYAYFLTSVLPSATE